MIKFEKNRVYLLKPVNIIKTEKNVTTKNKGTCIRYDISFVDKEGNTALCEWLCCTPENEDFTLNVFRYVRCLWLNDMGVTIEPSEEPGNAPSKQPSLSDNDIPLHLCHQTSVPVGGMSYTFTMSYAKDLKVAEIAKQPEGYKVTANDIFDITQWADALNDFLCTNGLKKSH